MKKTIFLFVSMLIFLSTMNAQTTNVIYLGTKKKVNISVDPSDAKLYVNGQMVTSGGSTQIKIPYMSQTTVKAEKVGYITQERNYLNNNTSSVPKADFIKLEEDDSYTGSVQTDLANKDVEVKAAKSEEDAWKELSMIVTNYFDVLDVSDRNTSYLRTAWSQKSFKGGTIRTRLIIKIGSLNPLTYKVKIASEKAKPGTSVKADEEFKEWDRLLRTYEPIISELQSRLGKS